MAVFTPIKKRIITAETKKQIIFSQKGRASITVKPAVIAIKAIAVNTHNIEEKNCEAENIIVK
ncbi:hypothetical protein HZC20_01875 [Candidatus Peregrinibacteria bacterium]|nr:hypothetical protein [Candidatus Peregrinibacteria bacterium]